MKKAAGGEERGCGLDLLTDNIAVELILDSGETKMLRQGDVLLQRGTRHDWRNPSETEPCRMVFFVLPAEIPEGAAES